MILFFFSSRRRHTRFDCDWSSDVCSSDLLLVGRIISASSATTRRCGRTPGPTHGLFSKAGRSASAQIGRASCRERVLISGVAELCKRKNNTMWRDTLVVDSGSVHLQIVVE